MPFEQAFLSLTALLMLCAAVMGSTNLFAGITEWRVPTVMAQHRPTIIDSQLRRINLKDLEIIVLIDNVEKAYKVVPAVAVTKDGRPVELAALAPGDHVVLHLVTGSGELVSRIEAVSSH
jgi:hypothetical protein